MPTLACVLGAERLVSYDDPALRHRQPLGVDSAQVVSVRIASSAERPQRGHLIAVVERQSGDGLTGTRHLRTESLAHPRHTNPRILPSPVSRAARTPPRRAAARRAAPSPSARCESIVREQWIRTSRMDSAREKEGGEKEGGRLRWGHGVATDECDPGRAAADAARAARSRRPQPRCAPTASAARHPRRPIRPRRQHRR